MGSSSLVKFTKGEVKVENIIKVAQQKHLMAYLKITSMGSSDLRVEGTMDALLAMSLPIMRRSVRIEGTHYLMMMTIIPWASSMVEGTTGTMAKEKGM